MKRFVRNVLLFILPFALGAVVVFVRPLDRRFAYGYLEGDCRGHALWIHDRIVESPLPIDVAFLGTSRTFRAVNDVAIERALRDDHGLPWHVVNLGYCRPGRDLHAVIAKLLLEARSVRHVVIEVDDRENPHSHPMQGYLVDLEDLVPPPHLWHDEVPEDLVQAFHVRFEAARQRWLLGRQGLRPQQEGAHGFVSVGGPPGSDDGPPRERARREAFLRHLEAEKVRRRARAERGFDLPERKLAFPRHYLAKIAALCRERGVRLSFLYLQSYGEPWARMREGAFYEGLAEVWLPPRALFEDPRMWRDDAHLADEGSAALAPWLAERLAGEAGR